MTFPPLSYYSHVSYFSNLEIHLFLKPFPKLLSSHRVYYMAFKCQNNEYINVSPRNMKPCSVWWASVCRTSIRSFCDCEEYHGWFLKLEYMILLMDGQQQFAPCLPVMLGESPDSPSKSAHILFQLAKVLSLIQTELTTKR